MPRCDACHTTAAGKYGTLIWKSCFGYKLYTPVWGWSWMDWTVWMVFFLQCGMSQGFSNGKHFWQLSKVFSMHAEIMQRFRLRRLAYCICLYVFVIDIPFIVPFLGGFPIRGSKLNLVGEFIRGRNAQLTKLHLTRDLHYTPGVQRCACLLCCFPLSWEDLQRRPCRQRNSAFVCSMKQ